ncbi:putative membrane protein [Paucibacter oligotrophus]|uniref:Putative membrane protein n=1 Tax=Roseateles oligotrophus TaxID=1769250 RepID=A0A840LD87_9BURK|nr:DUF1345 domain-containing protein [Roseateles oligotrophus]MBB4845681.1 putative membrane protein [Roseateles oligotrophus]
MPADTPTPSRPPRRRRPRLLALLQARPRLFIAAGLALAVGFLLPLFMTLRNVTCSLIAWNVGTTLYVALAALMMLRSDHGRMRSRASLQDDGQLFILVMAVVSALASLAAIAFELAVVKEMQGLLKSLHIGLAGYTVLSSWAFVQVMFALHYAHEYYAELERGHPPGLQFPGEQAPEYGDFFYFAAVIGTSGQTADVAFVSKPLRRIGSLHCILAYLFNTTVLALLINIGASLF